MAELPSAPMDASGVLAAEPLHEPSPGHIRDLQDEMDRLLLPAVRVGTNTTSSQHGREKSLERQVIIWPGEDRLGSIAALDDIVHAVRHVKSGSARHPCLPTPLCVVPCCSIWVLVTELAHYATLRRIAQPRRRPPAAGYSRAIKGSYCQPP